MHIRELYALLGIVADRLGKAARSDLSEQVAHDLLLQVNRSTVRIEESRILLNGAEILHRTQQGDYAVVLAQRGDDDYVTWNTGKDGYAFDGHYHHADFHAACADYAERCGE